MVTQGLGQTRGVRPLSLQRIGAAVGGGGRGGQGRRGGGSGSGGLRLLGLRLAPQFDQLAQDVVDERVGSQLGQHQAHRLLGSGTACRSPGGPAPPWGSRRVTDAGLGLELGLELGRRRRGSRAPKKVLKVVLGAPRFPDPRTVPGREAAQDSAAPRSSSASSGPSGSAGGLGAPGLSPGSSSMAGGPVSAQPDFLLNLGRMHQAVGVDTQSFAVVGESLLYMLQCALGPSYTGPLRQAWLNMYAVVVAAMSRGWTKNGEHKVD
ncbi:hypothetical protein CRUP_033160 [Coryphaenoides rupestris]|nr:hypothetical protein CRUP_033160 [Coryphaenoides rupestris]